MRPVRRSLGAGVILLSALVLLVGLQWGWIDELAQVQRAQARRLLQRSTLQIARELEAALAAAPEGAPPAATLVRALPVAVESALGPDAHGEHAFALVGPAGEPFLHGSAPAGEPLPQDEPDAEAGLVVPTARWTGRFQPLGGAPAVELPFGGGGESWQLYARCRSGSLDALVRRSRTKNLALAGGVLVTLVLGLAWSLVAERRASRLAERELAFVAGVSHELRSPLAVIRTAASNLSIGIVPAERVAEYGRWISGETERIAAMVEKALCFSDQRAATDPRIEELSIRAWIDDSLREACARDPRRARDIEVRIEPQLESVHGDRAMLRAALVNLVENAARHGKGVIRVHASRERRWLVVEVEDEGPGPRRGERSKIFEPFFRGQDARRGAVPGSGLGLAIVAQAAALHGGEASGSRGPRGAVFRLRLPLEGPSPAEGRAG